MTRAFAVAGALLLSVGVASCEWSPDEESGPEQPIAFFHSVHAGENQIPCMYCHYTADRSQSAGIPSVKLCVGCHVPGSATAPPENATLAFPTAERNEFWNQEATKLVEYWRRQEPIPWVKVHDLPEHVKFPHFMHVNAGLQCQTCHGPVEEMEKVYQFSSMQMGWCVDCHRGELPLSPEEEEAVRLRSGYARKIAAMGEAGGDVRGAIGLYPGQRASTDCVVCHY